MVPAEDFWRGITVKRKIAIACQGGGSQTAFTAGVLHGLFEEGIQEDFEVASLSGTSGGAVCAALVWYAIKKGESPVWKRLLAFWNDNTPLTVDEQFFNNWIVQWVRAINSGLWPSLQISPGSHVVRNMMSYFSIGKRRAFLDFAELLKSHIDFEEVASWGPLPETPVLVMGAANVLTGQLRKFISSKEIIRVEHVLASCAVPNLFPAVQIGEDAYWDGLFSDNPPVDELIRPSYVGWENVAEEIWVIKINPTTSRFIPVQPDDIFDRRNQLEGNISLFHQLVHLEQINDLIRADAFTQEFLNGLGIRGPVLIPKSFSDDVDKPYHIPCIEMSPELQAKLDYESKIDRSSRNLDSLIEDGRRQARKFLKARAAVVRHAAAELIGPAETKAPIPRGPQGGRVVAD
jgi:NTE family protein